MSFWKTVAGFMSDKPKNISEPALQVVPEPEKEVIKEIVKDISEPVITIMKMLDDTSRWDVTSVDHSRSKHIQLIDTITGFEFEIFGWVTGGISYESLTSSKGEYKIEYTGYATSLEWMTRDESGAVCEYFETYCKLEEQQKAMKHEADKQAARAVVMEQLKGEM